ncbi:MAG TPA: hypothetical protein VFQ37_08970, partial [Mycobacterium sp.]|nr:hypothetical protein [Mycobacterium sp.]
VDITHEYAFNHVDTALVANVGLPLQASLEVGLTSDSEPGGSVSVNFAQELPFKLGDLRQTPALGP